MQNQSHMPRKYTCPRLKSFQSCNHDTSKGKPTDDEIIVEDENSEKVWNT